MFKLYTIRSNYHKLILYYSILNMVGPYLIQNNIPPVHSPTISFIFYNFSVLLCFSKISFWHWFHP
ncbi:hypothetical protein HanRHA438_Chr04g0163081 [Helianthus annuus]|nr:hypothetical protein HanRHA438_Chr04g0163081 [Helianthus annuus]